MDINKLGMHIASLHCFLHMITIHNKIIILTPIIQKLKLGRFEKLYLRFKNIWFKSVDISYSKFLFYLQHYPDHLIKQINYRKINKI